MNWQRLRAAGALVFAGAFACAPLDEPVTTPTSDDGASFGDDIAETLGEQQQPLSLVTLGEFEATVDPESGAISIEMLDPADWFDQRGLDSDLRETQQANYCRARVSGGAQGLCNSVQRT